MPLICSIFVVSISQSSNGTKSCNKRFVYFICLVSVMGGFLFGYDWVVTGGVKSFYELYFGIANIPAMQGFVTNMALLGCPIDVMVTGMMADRYGRKPLLIISAFIFSFSAYTTGASFALSWFLAACLLGDIGIGIASGFSPMYTAEVVLTSIRGKLVSLNQLTIVPGILGVQIANQLIAEPTPADFPPMDVCASWNGQMGWRWMFWAVVFPAAIFLLLVCFIPENPRWLAMREKEEKTWNVLSKIGGDGYADQELRLVEETGSSRPEGGLRLLFSRPFYKTFVSGIIVAVFQQWCGTNVIFNCAQEIFQPAGYSLGNVLFNIMVTGVTNVVFTFVATYTVGRSGHRAPMLLGTGGLVGIYLILGTCYFFKVSGFSMVVLVMLAIACHVMSPGPATWVLFAEIFPNRVHTITMAACTFALRVSSLMLTYTFPLLNNFLGGSGTFWIYAVIHVVGYLFFFRASPEMKGKPLETLEKDLIKQKK